MASESFDVVIVGAGTGGLNVGALLASAGKKILVLEKQDRVGGRTFSVKHKNTFIENGIHGLILSGHQDEVYRRVGKTLPQNVNTWKSSQIYLDGEWQNFESLLADSTEELEKLLKDAVFDRSYEQIQKLNDISVEKFISDRTNDEGVLVWFRYMGWIYGGTRFPPTDFSAGALFCTFKRRADAHGGKLTDLGYMVEGGCGGILPPLVETIVENGGEVRTNSRVSKVVIENGWARGVEVESQERVIPTQVVDTEFIEAPVVVSAVPLWDVLNVVSEDDLPPWYAERIRFFSRKTLNVWTLNYVLDNKPSIDESDLMCVTAGPISGRPWIAGCLPFADTEGQYSVICWMNTGWHQPPSVFHTAKASVKVQVRQLFDAWEADVRELFPELEADCLWKVRSFGPASIVETPGNVGKHLISMVPEGVEGLYLVGEKTQEAEIMGIYGSAQVALKCADRILKQ
ncbi:MAG: FAD-dependent oxidoreductase [Deltaproteobacteria bacterium]|nr:FAD-dependent oxidoreductase [Deltaproteobacteria bacterium]